MNEPPHEPFDAIILAGGLGTRLRPVVDDVPKSMASVAGRPFIEYLLAQLAAAGCSRVVLCSGFLSDVLESHLAKGERFGMELVYSKETEPRGTAGALKLAEPLLRGDRWLLMNGDSLFDISLQSLIGEHARRPALVTIALARVPDGHRYGSVTCDADGTITAFAEKTDAVTPGLINSGLYIIERPLLALIPADRPVSLERDVITPLAMRGPKVVRGAEFDGYFIDIGIPEDFARAQSDAAIFERLNGSQEPV